jgi:phosphopentomutase
MTAWGRRDTRLGDLLLRLGDILLRIAEHDNDPASAGGDGKRRR